MAFLINLTKLLKWEIRPFKILNGTYRDYRWVIYNIRDSKLYPTCFDYDLDIISLNTDRVIDHSSNSTRHLGPTVRGMHRRIHHLLYDNEGTGLFDPTPVR